MHQHSRDQLIAHDGNDAVEGRVPSKKRDWRENFTQSWGSHTDLSTGGQTGEGPGLSASSPQEVLRPDVSMAKAQLV
jgi:hypothetical protein